MPTNDQILGAKIRAARDAFINAKRKPFKGGFEVPPQREVYNHLAHIFSLSPVEISYYLTYSRSCIHTWSAGACDDCPTRG